MTKSKWAVVLSLSLAGCGDTAEEPQPQLGASVSAALERAVERSHARGAFILVADARTGRVLASEQRGLGAVPDRIDPASLLKPLLVEVALEQGATTLDEVHDCGPAPTMGFDTAPRLSTADTVVYSSNRCAARIAGRLPPGAIAEGLRRLGVELSLQSRDVPGSSFDEAWVPGDAGGCAKPGELLEAYVALANGGEKTRGLREALRRAVSEGTGKAARSTRVTTAGKTGTSMGTGLQCATGERVSSFAGFAPAEAPRVVVLAAVIEPEGELPLGSRYAAPLFKDVVEGALAR